MAGGYLRYLMGVVPLAALGCVSTTSAPDPDGLSRALKNYDAGWYAQARQEAAEVRHEGDIGTRSRALYLEGLCAYQLGDHDAARPLLAEAARGSGPEAARASATLGLVYRAQNRPDDAGDAFAAAARGLSGVDASKAVYYAARCYAEAGDEAAAALWTRILQQPRPAGSSGAAPGTFTIQVGAFRERSHAERAAVEAAEVAESHGLAPVRIVPRRDTRGDVLFVVQLGSFRSRSAAMGARRRLGNLQYIVATQTPG